MNSFSCQNLAAITLKPCAAPCRVGTASESIVSGASYSAGPERAPKGLKLSTTMIDWKDDSRFKASQRLGHVRITEGGPPTHPGEMLLEEFLKPLGVSQRQLADATFLPYRHVNEIINKRRRITPAIALRFTRYLGMSVGFWMNLQLSWDLYFAIKSDKEILDAIEPLPRPDMPELMKLAGIEEKDTE